MTVCKLLKKGKRKKPPLCKKVLANYTEISKILTLTKRTLITHQLSKGKNDINKKLNQIM